LKRRGHLEVSYVPRVEDMAAEVTPLLRGGDLVVVLGAGNILAVADQLVRSLNVNQNTWTVQ
jgi:UDP-N-acetylmuramate-alanine ligase